MRELVARNLSAHVDAIVVDALLASYERMIAEFRRGDAESCLGVSGKFVEHALRAVEFIRSRKAPAEIKSPSALIREIEKDQNLPESVRILIPRIAHAMVYDIRSKRGAVHVKEISPRQIDASLSVQAASWIIAEFLRLYHVDAESDVARAIHEIVRTHIPLIETFDDEEVVTSVVSVEVELLLLVTKSMPAGCDRTMLGRSSKHLPSTVTRGLQRLEKGRLMHKTRSGKYFVTGPGEKFLSDELAKIGAVAAGQLGH